MRKFSLSARFITFLLGPLLFVLFLSFFPKDLIAADAGKVLAVAAWMVTWWITEAVPIPVTALLPMVCFPFLGVMSINQSTSPYANPIIFLFMGGFMLALALEKHRLHERIALNLIKLTGTSGNGIILGFMMATGLLSMWISNTATAMMMLPIAISVVTLIIPNKEALLSGAPSPERNFALGLLLSIGYAASLGGLATIIGTPPNVVFKGLLQQTYGIELTFAKWMLVGVPVAIALLLSNYLITTNILFPNKLKKIEGSDELIAHKLKELGPMCRREKFVLAIFSATSFLWIFQQPINSLTGTPLLNDTNIAMTGGMLMFLFPVDLNHMTFLLSWGDTKKLSWGILLLFGGGLCLADGLQRAGIIQAIGGLIAAQNTYNLWLVLMLIVIGVSLSELMSNVALVNIFVPVVFGIAQGLEANPILLALPVTLSASIAFMFPIATPPNAIVFSSGYIRVKDMVRAGILLNMASVALIFLASITLVRWIFE